MADVLEMPLDVSEDDEFLDEEELLPEFLMDEDED